MVYNDFPDDEAEQKRRLNFLKQHIIAELNICELDRFDYFLDGLNEELRELTKKINDLKNHFENHRHAQDKTYGEKPIW